MKGKVFTIFGGAFPWRGTVVALDRAESPPPDPDTPDGVTTSSGVVGSSPVTAEPKVTELGGDEVEPAPDPSDPRTCDPTCDPLTCAAPGSAAEVEARTRWSASCCW